MTDAQTPDGLLRAALAADPARPLITFYDDATGERVELSAETFANWVAKTANLLQDELSAEPGDPALLLLPAHWQAAVWLHACWAVGLPVAAGPDADPRQAAVVVSGPDEADLARARTAAGAQRVALALRPLGGRFPATPDGFLDYDAEVPGQGDRFSPYQPVDPQDPALLGALAGGDGTADASGAETVRRARAWAADHGLADGARVLSTRPLDGWDGLAAGLLAPLAVGGSTVLVRNADRLTDQQLTRRQDTEQVTDVFR